MEEIHNMNISSSSFIDNPADTISNWALELEMSL